MPILDGHCWTAPAVAAGQIFARNAEVLDVSEAQAESVIEPDGVGDDLGRESVPAVARCWRAHSVSLPAVAST